MAEEREVVALTLGLDITLEQVMKGSGTSRRFYGIPFY